VRVEGGPYRMVQGGKEGQNMKSSNWFWQRQKRRDWWRVKVISQTNLKNILITHTKEIRKKGQKKNTESQSM